MSLWQHWRQRAADWKREHQVSDAEIAERVGRKRPTVNSWLNKREPNLADFIAICEAMRADPAAILFGRPLVNPDEAREPPALYVEQLSPEALDVARAWSKLTPARQHAIREWVFLETVVTKHYPWLIQGRPPGESYNDYEKAVEQDIVRIAGRMLMTEERNKGD